MKTVKHTFRVFNWDTEKTTVKVERFNFDTELAAEMFIHSLNGRFAETIAISIEV
jgi:hypothetical protein